MVSIFIMKLNGSRSKHMWLNRLWMNGNYYLFSYMFFITFSYFDLIWCNRPEGVCACVCVCVCMCVCVLVSLYSPIGWTDFDEIFQKSPAIYLLNTFFSDFENSNLITPWQPFLLFSVPVLSRSQFYSNFLQILWRERGTPFYFIAIWKQENWLITLEVMALPRFRKI